MKNFTELIKAAKKQPTKRLVVVNGVDVNTLEALDEAVELGFVRPILTGVQKRIEEKLHSLHIDSRRYEIINVEKSREATEKSVQLVHDGEADLIMKGMVSTDQFMKVLLKKEYGLLPSKATLTHISVM